MGKKVLSVLSIVVSVIALIALSWASTSFIYWLITLCFGIEWTLQHATGIWLICVLLSSSFNTKIKN